jgi:mRNA interferase HigB
MYYSLSGNRSIVPNWGKVLSVLEMKVVGRQCLEDFIRRHSDVRGQADAWLCEVVEAQWQGPQDIKARYAHASFLSDNRVIFNLKGNRYRLDVKVNYTNQIVNILRVGTHAEYSRWDF